MSNLHMIGLLNFDLDQFLWIASNLPSRMKDTDQMLNVTDDINNSNLCPESIVLSFDISRSIDNKIRINYVIKLLDVRMCKVPPAKCVIEAFELCLSCNNSVFNNTNYIQTDGTAQGPSLLWSHANIVI